MNDDVFYRSTMHWRKVSTLIVSIFLCLIGVPISGFAIVHIPEIVQDTKSALVGLILFLVGGIFSWAGIAHSRCYFSAKCTKLIVNEEGVTYDEQQFRWHEIGALSARRYGRKIQLLLHRRGRIALDRPLVSDNGILEAEYDELIQKLRLHISPKFPHIRFG